MPGLTLGLEGRGAVRAWRTGGRGGSGSTHLDSEVNCRRRWDSQALADPAPCGSDTRPRLHRALDLRRRVTQLPAREDRRAIAPHSDHPNLLRCVQRGVGRVQVGLSGPEKMPASSLRGDGSHRALRRLVVTEPKPGLGSAPSGKQAAGRCTRARGGTPAGSSPCAGRQQTWQDSQVKSKL